MRNSISALAAISIAGGLVLAASPAAYAEGTLGDIGVTPTGVEFADECGTMNDGFFLPEPQEGVVRYEFQGGFGEGYTVTAILADGYVLAEGAGGVQEFPALTDEPCDVDPEPTDPSEPSTPADVTPPIDPAQPITPAEVAAPSVSPMLAETGFEDGLFMSVAAAALLLGGALVLGVRRARRHAAE